MTRPSRPRELRDDELALIRLVANGEGNEEIAAVLGVTVTTVQGRLGTLYSLLGVKSTDGRPDALSRVRLTAWAYKSGLMDGVPAAPAAIPDVLTARVIEVCEAIHADLPRGDLRKVADEVLAAAGRLRRPNLRRIKPARLA